MQDITIEEARRLNNALFIDVRSPAEFNEATIPGAVNLPLLNDDERAQVGTVYRHQGPEDAQKLGWGYVSPKLNAMMGELKKLADSGPAIVFCWRGGLRSKSVCAAAEHLGIPVLRLAGGYKSYRRLVNEYFQQHKLPGTPLVLHGLTGVGKTEILLHIKKLGGRTIDLEGLASNRGSVFGGIDIGAQPTQKQFESRLMEALLSSDQEGYFAVECESKRIGRLMIPDSFFKAMAEGGHVLVYASMEQRIRRLVAIYAGTPGNERALQQAVEALARRLGREKVEELKHLIGERQFAPVVEYLLVNYYDPLYRYPDGPSDRFACSVCADDSAAAAREILKYMHSLCLEVISK